MIQLQKHYSNIGLILRLFLSKLWLDRKYSNNWVFNYKAKWHHPNPCKANLKKGTVSWIKIL